MSAEPTLVLGQYTVARRGDGSDVVFKAGQVVHDVEELKRVREAVAKQQAAVS